MSKLFKSIKDDNITSITHNWQAVKVVRCNAPSSGCQKIISLGKSESGNFSKWSHGEG